MKLNNYFNTNNQFKMMMQKTSAQEIAELKAKVAKLEMYNQELEMQNKMYKKSTQGKLNDKLLSKIKQLEEQNNILIDKNKKQDLSIMQLQHNVNRVEKENIKLKKENERVYSLLDKKEKQITDLTDKVNIYKEEVGLLKNENKEMTKNNDLLNTALDCFQQFIQQYNLNEAFTHFVDQTFESQSSSSQQNSYSRLLSPDQSYWNKSANKSIKSTMTNNRDNNHYNDLIRNNANFLNQVNNKNNILNRCNLNQSQAMEIYKQSSQCRNFVSKIPYSNTRQAICSNNSELS